MKLLSRTSQRLKRLGSLLIALPTLTLGACASPTQTVVTDTGCLAFSRATFDRLNDTLPTITWVKDYDARRDAICGVGK